MYIIKRKQRKPRKEKIGKVFLVKARPSTAQGSLPFDQVDEFSVVSLVFEEKEKLGDSEKMVDFTIDYWAQNAKPLKIEAMPKQIKELDSRCKAGERLQVSASYYDALRETEKYGQVIQHRGNLADLENVRIIEG